MHKKTDGPPLSKERRQYLKKQKQRKRRVLYWQIGILVVFIAVWEIAARAGLIDSFILSQPTRILRTYLNMAQNDLLMHMGVTIYETLVGFLLARRRVPCWPSCCGGAPLSPRSASPISWCSTACRKSPWGR